MKKILIVGASILQVPAIQKAKEMGLYVGVVDYDSNAIGISYADEFFNVSTIDEEGVFQAAKTFKADGIMTLATDMPMRSVAYAANKLGLVGISYETAVKATDKGEMIKAFETAGVEHPWYFILKRVEEVEKYIKELTYPCISKPTDNAGSRGVVLIENKSKLKEALLYSAKNSRHGEIIIEEYLQGKEVSVEVMVINSIPYILQVTDKITTGAPHFVELGHTQPSQIDEKKIAQIERVAIKAVQAVGIDNGPAHVEIMLTTQGPKMIELGARMGGDCITTHLVPLSTGIDMIKATIDIALGNIPDITKKCDKGSAIRYLKAKCGCINNIVGIEQAKSSQGICNVCFTKKIGEEIGEIESSTSRVGYVIAQGENAIEAADYCEDAVKKIDIL